MGPFAMRTVVLAVIALLCIWPSAYADKRDAELDWSIPFTYSDNGVQYTGGLYFNITGQEDKVYLWSKYPATTAMFAWDVNTLVASSSAEAPLFSTTNFSVGAGSGSQYFRYATTDGTNFYFITDGGVFIEVPAADLEDENPISGAVNLAGYGPVLHLRNVSSDLWVTANAPNTYSLIKRDDLSADLANPDSLPPTEMDGTLDKVPNFAWITSCQISSSYGYLIGTSKNTVYMYRANATVGIPDPAIILRDVYIPSSDAPCYYSAESDTLYLGIVNASIVDEEGANVLVKISNWTTFDTGSGVAYNDSLTPLITASAEAQITSSSVRRDASLLSLCLIIDEDGTLLTGANPLTLNVDEAGGQALMIVAGGTVSRINVGTMTTSSPALALSGGTVLGAGSGFYTPSITDRILLAFGADTLWKYQMDSACPSNCGDSLSPPTGFCVAGICECVEGRHGADCSGILCDSDCGTPLGRGNCSLSGVCLCAPEWTGTNCTQRRCPNDCYDNGVCNEDDWTCSCNSLWTGADCSIAAFTACQTFNNERDCVSKLGACGWCADNKKCVTGNLDGPYQGSCRAWYAGGKYQVGLLVAAIIVIVVFFLMLFVGILSAMPIDYVTASILADSSLLSTDFLKEAYLRDERSAKTWKMFDLFQFISYYAFINVSFPTQMIQFSRYFNWANMMLPLPYGYEDNTTLHPNRLPANSGGGSSTGSSRFSVNSRSLLNAEQYANSVKVDTENIFYGTLFWFAMLVCAVLVVYAIYAFILWLCLRKKEPFIKTLLLQKVFHILTRLVLIGMIPLNFTAAWHIRQGSRPHNGTIAAAIAVIIIFGILPIVFNAIVVWGKSKELIFLFLKLRFGALYSVYHYQKARFNLIVLIKKLAVALLLGFIAASSNTQSKYVYAQVFTIVAVFVIYAIVTVIIRPYLDQIHLLLDVVMSLLFALAFGIAVLHRNSPSTAGQVVWGVCLILIFVACVIAFIHSWWNMSGRNTNPKVLCGPRYGGLEEDENVNDSELDAAVQIRNKKEKQAALAGAMPASKAAAAHPAETDDEDVDSSLQSSSSEPEEESSESSSRSSSEEEEESDE